MTTASATFDKPNGYTKGETVTLTVVDPSRINDFPVTIPSVGGAISADFKVFGADGQPTDTGNHVWALVTDNPATGTTVWSTTA